MGRRPPRTRPVTIRTRDVIRVDGGGAAAPATVPVVGAKNSALKLMAAALLAPGRTVITNVPRITDIAIMGEVLRRLGCEVTFGPDPQAPPAAADRARTVTLDVPQRPAAEADYDLVRRLRASICVLGPLLARCGHVRVAHPGGDAIGSRGPGHAHRRADPDGRARSPASTAS